MMKRQFLMAVVSLTCACAHAYNRDMYPYELPAGAQGAAMGCTKAVAGMKLEPGRWYTNFQVCKKYADDNGMPLFAVWGNTGCVHCWYTEVVFIQSAFREFLAGDPAGQVILCFMSGGHDTVDQFGSTAYNWMYTGGGTKLTVYPFCAFWWQKGGVNLRYTGDQLCAGANGVALGFTDASVPQRVQNVIAKFRSAFAKWQPVPVEPVPAWCSVSFSPGGGRGSMQGMRYRNDRAYALPGCTFTPPGGRTRFAGWAGSDGRRYDDGVLFLYGGGSSTQMTMTAIWE